MQDLGTLRERWGFLKTIHPLFNLAESLPTVERVDQGHYGWAAGEDGDHLKNEITLLRSDFKLNVIKQLELNIDQLNNDYPFTDRLKSNLEALLQKLEHLIDSQVISQVGRLKELEVGSKCASEPESLRCFPRLIALRKLLWNQESLTPSNIQDEFVSADNLEPSALTGPDTISTRTVPSWSGGCSPTLIAQVTSLIRFPQDIAEIGLLRRVVSRFRDTMDAMMDWRLNDSGGLSAWVDQVVPKCTAQDVDTIKNAHNFASTSASLFSQMIGGTKCGTPHKAKLHLSGFKENQLKMNIGTCHGTHWISTVFTPSCAQPSSKPFHFDNICSPEESRPEESEVLHIGFNSEGMWTSNNAPELGSPTTLISGEQTLDHLLTKKDYNDFKSKYRKLTLFLLAASIFQLSDTPWIEQHFEAECILVPLPSDNKPMQQWCPRFLCTLVSNKNTRLQSDNIAALGVLILELETRCKADWAADDAEWPSMEKSNHVRLARILDLWRDDVSDKYRTVAKACLNFDRLLENLDHPEIVSEKRGLAVIYKCILEPLFALITTNFGDLATHINGICGFGGSLAAPLNISPSGTGKQVLFDDDDSLPRKDDQNSAQRFLDSLSFLEKIRDLHKPNGTQEYKRIRIVVLDSGVDDQDSGIRGAMRSARINTQMSKSFVGLEEEWQQDSYGHGTHVTKLLLKTAPAAEIYVGKICTDKFINDEFMPGIAKAINWAVNECQADIISMSFGFEDENDQIDIALDNATRAGKLIIAAASNNKGGRSGRARPARREDVICIHATDGQGNKGGMNPSPQAQKDNFATLGVAVPLKWKESNVCKSGTSFAAPIAAGFAADILEFAKYRCTNLKKRRLDILHQKAGMEAVFREMAKDVRDGYSFIYPVRFWGNLQDEKAELQAAKAIQDIMEKF